MLLILDKWIFHDLQNGEDRQQESFRFLEKIKEKCDKIAWIQNSKFENKYWSFAKLSSRDTELKMKFKFLEFSFRFNSLKIQLLDVKNDNLYYETKEIFKKINKDDHYILLSYFYSKKENQECIIITTDVKLKDILEKEGIAIKLRDEFIEKYLKNDS
jgi:hypothetical protein